MRIDTIYDICSPFFCYLAPCLTFVTKAKYLLFTKLNKCKQIHCKLLKFMGFNILNNIDRISTFYIHLFIFKYCT